MSTKQQLHELLAANLLEDVRTVIERLDNSINRANVYTPSNEAIRFNMKLLAYKADKLRDTLVTTPDNGLAQDDPNYERYTL